MSQMPTRAGRTQLFHAPGIQGGTGGNTGVDASITTLAQLAAIPTTNLTPPVVKVWVLEADGTSQVWRLLASTAATVAGSIQRPDDYSASNEKVWFKASS